MDDDVKARIAAGAQVIIICMPLARLSEYVRKRDGIISAECMVCHGAVALNPLTYKGGAPSSAATICAACAVDLIDADGGVDQHTFAFTDAQEAGEGLTEAAKEAVRTGAKAMAPTMVDAIRKRRAEFDASSSAKTGAN